MFLIYVLLYARVLILEKRMSQIHKVVNLNVDEFVIVVSPTDNLYESLSIVKEFIADPQ